MLAHVNAADSSLAKSRAVRTTNAVSTAVNLEVHGLRPTGDDRSALALVVMSRLRNIGLLRSR
jgi:hypothetical protein